MKYEDIDLEEMPQRLDFLKTMTEEFARWEVYTPTLIEKDIPFKRHWWKYLYWMPTLKKEIYLTALSSNIFEVGIQEFCLKYGIDYDYLADNYGEILRRASWMRKNNKTRPVSGEVL